MDTPTAEQVADIIARLGGNGYMVEPREAASMLSALQAERERLARRNAELEAELRANGETALRAQAMEIDRLSGPTKRLPPPPEKENDNR